MGRFGLIDWCHHTFNAWRGCVKISPGCAHCYAETLSHRNPGVLGVWGPNGTRVVAAESAWRQPLAWDAAAAKAGERHRVFCASLADVFEDWAGQVVNSKGERLWIGPRDPNAEFRVCNNREGSFLPHECFEPVILDDVRARLFRLILRTPHLDWLLLTKRPQNIGRLWPVGHEFTGPGAVEWPNVWLGTTVEDQARADGRIPHLLATPAAVRFLSVEPLLEPVDLTPWLYGEAYGSTAGKRGGPGGQLVTADPSPIRWVIVGGESGPKARPMHPNWARSIRDECVAAGVPFFFKQWGEWAEADLGNVADAKADRFIEPDGRDKTDLPLDTHSESCAHMVRIGKKAAGRLLDGRTWDQFPGETADDDSCPDLFSHVHG